MKQLFTLVGLTALIAILTACEVRISGVDIGLPPGITISNASYVTNYQAKVNGTDRFIICDNETTTLSYSFDFSGSLQSWSSYLRGKTTGTIKGQANFSSANIVAPGRVEVTYTIPQFMTPLSTDESISPQAIIIIEKPVIIGYTQLYVTINGYTKSYPLSSSDIPVVNTCP